MFLSADVSPTRGPTDDFWYMPVGNMTGAGVRVTPDLARSLTAVDACVKVLSETLAVVPLHLYRYLDNDGKERARKHPLYHLLHRRPNAWQTSYSWRLMMQGHAALRGNAYSEIIFMPNGMIKALIPLHPDRTKIEMIGENNWRYRYTDLQNRERIIPREAMFHLRGLSADGIIGLSPIDEEREALGLGLAAQQYGSTFYRNGAQPGGVIEWEGSFKDPTTKRQFRSDWQEAQTGGNRHKVAVLEKGMAYKEIGIKHTDAQFLETRRFQAEEVARIFRMPPHKIQMLDRATNNNIESQGIDFVTDTMLPWYTNWEQALTMDLLNEDEEQMYFAEFMVEGLQRGDAAARSAFYTSGITNGWLTRNEVRVKENMNPLPGLDEPLSPLNMRQGSNAPQDKPAAQAPALAARMRLLTHQSAQRVLNKELQAARKTYTRILDTKGADAAHQFSAWVAEFYEGHAQWVSEMMACPLEEAERYSAAAMNQLLGALNSEVIDRRPAVLALLDEWETNKAEHIAKLGEVLPCTTE